MIKILVESGIGLLLVFLKDAVTSSLTNRFVTELLGRVCLSQSVSHSTRLFQINEGAHQTLAF